MHIITEASDQTNRSWQAQLNDLITDPAELAQRLELPADSVSLHAAEQFGLRLPRRMLDKIEPGKLDDPILRQFLPHANELDSPPDYSTDPLQEEQSNPIPGLIHKYHGRVLITAVGHCAINCRYCFRRHFNYQDNRIKRLDWLRILEYLTNNPTVSEVIFSGGDPLAASNGQWERWISDLESLGSIKRIRIHSRLPVVIPDRIDPHWLRLMSNTKKMQKILVIHANHPREIDPPLIQALHRLRQQDVTLLNQTVLLKGVNNHAKSLIELSESLFNGGVLPYYLHLLDPVRGAADFDVYLEQALQIHRELQRQLPGYLVPKLVRELPGEPSKTWVHGS